MFVRRLVIIASLLVASLLACAGLRAQEILWLNEPGSGHSIQRYNPGTGQVSIFATGLGARARALAYNPSDDRVYVASQKKIQRYDRNGNVVDTFVTSETITTPIDMKFDKSGNLFVANMEPGRVIRYTPSGVESLVNPKDLSPIGLATSLAFGPDDRLYVSSMNAWSVVVDAGGVWRSFTTSQAGIPERMAWGPDGKLYVTIYGEKPARDKEILRFKSDGSLDGKFADLTFGAGILWTPDAKLYATDHATNKVYRFDDSGASTLVTENCNAPGAMIYLPPPK